MDHIEIIVRAVIVHNKQLLLVRQVNGTNTFLPGGHIEQGENAQAALQREIKEELGLPVTRSRFMGTVEHSFGENDTFTHEVNLVFKTDIPGLVSTEIPHSQEDHIEFLWCPLTDQDLQQHNMQPWIMRKSLKSNLETWPAFLSTIKKQVL